MVYFFMSLSCFRYEDFSDAVVLLAKLGCYTKDDEMIVMKKAKAIMKCFIDSQVPPRIQVNPFISSFLFFTRSEQSRVGMICIKMKCFWPATAVKRANGRTILKFYLNSGCICFVVVF